MALARLEKERARLAEIIQRLHQEFPHVRCSLDYQTPFQLMVATILSAQCTDDRVNKVTPELFKQFPTPHTMARAKSAQIEKLIRSAGFFRTKTRSILAAAQALVDLYKGEVPRTLEELVELKGIGRKTANVILGNAFGIHVGIAVDTHVGRLSRRLDFSREKDPVKVEQDLLKIVDPQARTLVSHLLIYHGRKTCGARNPDCLGCNLKDLCPRVGMAKVSA